MSNDLLANALDMTPLSVEPVPQTKVPAKSGEEYHDAKNNMSMVIDVGNQALVDLADMARQSQDPRVYRVLTELISALTTANKETLEIKKTNMEMEGKQDSPQTVHNNLFVGSTAELAQALQQMKK